MFGKPKKDVVDKKVLSQENDFDFALRHIKSGVTKEGLIAQFEQRGNDINRAREMAYIFYDQVIKRARDERFEPSCLGPAIVGGVLAAIISGIVWGLVIILTQHEIGYLAIGVGFLAGLGVVKFSKGKKGIPLQVVAVVASILGIIVGKYTAAVHFLLNEYVPGYWTRIKPLEMIKPYFSIELIRAFFTDVLPNMLSFYDILWVVLAIATAIKVPQSLGVKEGTAL